MAASNRLDHFNSVHQQKAECDLKAWKFSNTVSIDNFSSHLQPDSEPCAFVFPWGNISLTNKLQYQFHLEIRPKREYAKHLSAEMFFSTLQATEGRTVGDQPTSMRIRFNLSILDFNGTICQQKGKVNHEKCLIPISRGFPRFVHQSFVQDPNNGILKNDTLTVLCEVKRNTKCIANIKQADELEITELGVNQEKITPFAEKATQKEMGKNVGHSPKVQKTAEKISSEVHEPERRVTFKFKNGKTISCEKYFLRKYPAFQTVFEANQTCEAIQVADDYETFKHMLDFIMYNSHDPLPAFADKLLVIASKYGLREIRSVCCDYLANNVKKTNFVEIYQLGQGYELEKLKNASVEFVKKTRGITFESSYQKLLKENAEFREAVLNS